MDSSQLGDFQIATPTSEEFSKLEEFRKTLLNLPQTILSSQNSMSIRLDNMQQRIKEQCNRQSKGSMKLMNIISQEENKQIEDKWVCIEPVCLELKRQLGSQPENHKDHKLISLKQLLQDLQSVRCNEKLKIENPQRTKIIFTALDRIYSEIEQFESQLLRLLSAFKIKTYQHISEAKVSFESSHYQQIKQQLLKSFDYKNAQYALSEISKYKKLKFQNLDYPDFKSGYVLQRITEINENNKAICLTQLTEWIKRLSGDNASSLKAFNKSTITFMYKSPSEKKIFSYYLRHPEYQVVQYGKKLKRVQEYQLLPLAMIQQQLGKEGIKLKVSKLGNRGIAIGCGILRAIQSSNFNNCYKYGYFLHSNGALFSQKIQDKMCFKYKAGDIITIRKEKYRIFFSLNKKGDRNSQQFYIDLDPYESNGNLYADAKYYVGAYLGDKETELEIIQ